MPNPFAQFESSAAPAVTGANPFAQFEETAAAPPPAEPLQASAFQGAGQTQTFSPPVFPGAEVPPQDDFDMPQMPAEDAAPSYQGFEFNPSFNIPQGQQLHSFQDFWNRGVVKNVGEIGQGLTVLGNVAKARMADAVTPQHLLGKDPLQQLGAAFKRVTGDPVQAAVVGAGKIAGVTNPVMPVVGAVSAAFGGDPAMGTKPLLRPFHNPEGLNDLAQTAQFAGDVAQSYSRNYIDPIAHGDFGRVAGYVSNNPVYAAMDAASIPGPMVKMGMAPIKGVASMTAKAATKAVPALPAYGRVAEGIGTVIGGAAKEAVMNSPLAKSAQHWSLIRDLISKADKAWQKEFKELMEYVEEAYNAIPKKWSEEDLTAIITMSDMDKYVQATMDPDFPKIQAYMDRANSVNHFLGEKLKKAGVMTQRQIETATYGDFVLGNLRRQHPDLPASFLNTEEGWQHIQAAKASMENMKQKPPVYMGIIPKPVSDAVRTSEGAFGGVGKTLKGAVKKDVTVPGSGDPHFATPREAGFRNAGQHEMSPIKAFEVRLRQELAYLHIKELFESMIDNPTLKGSAEAQEFFVKDYFDKLAKATGLPSLPNLPDVISIPGWAKNDLEAVLSTPATNLVNKVNEAANRVFKTLTLGLKPSWAAMQSVQNMGVSFWSKFRGMSPNEIAASVMAHFVAFDPAIQKMMPAGVNMTNYGEKPLVKGLAKLLAPITDKVFGAATWADNYTRTAHAAYELIKQIENAGEYRVPLEKAFSLMARYDQIEKAIANPQYALKAVAEVNKWFGDYSEIAAQMWREPRAWFPFFLWWIHSGTLTKAALVQTPGKSRALAHLAKNAPPYFQNNDVDDYHKRLGMVAMYDLQGQVRKGPNQGNLLMGGGAGMLPMTQTLDLMEKAYQHLHGTVDTRDSSGLPVVTPMVAFGVGMIGKNPQNLQDWSDPTKVHSGGKQYRHDDETGEWIEVTPAPNPPQLLLRAIAPGQETLMRDLFAGDEKASDFTTPFVKAPKRGQGDEPLKSYPILEQIFYSITGMKPTEAIIDKDTADMMKAREQQRVERAANKYQSQRTTPEPTWIGEILGGKK